MSQAVLAFCGLGLMGAPMVQRLLGAGYRVRVWNRSPGKAETLRAAGAEVALTPAEAAEGCAAVFLCLTDKAAVDATVFGEHGVHRVPGGYLVDHSSISPADTKMFARRLHTAGGRIWIDAPVSGGVSGAHAGTLAIMAGGPESAFNDAAVWMRAYAARITHMGETGAGQVSKLCNQTIVAATINAIAEAIALAQHSGINAAHLNTALAGGWADSTLLQIFVPRMTAPIGKPLGSVSTMLKDIENVAALANETGTPMHVLQAVRHSFQIAAKQGLAAADLSEIVRVPWHDKPYAASPDTP